MTRISQILPAALLAAAIAATPAIGQAQGQAHPAPQGAAKSDDDHSAHHPSDKPAAPATPASGAPAAGAPGQPPGMGMGMMGSGGAGGMMGGDMGAMMQHMMPMMRGMMAQGMDRMDGPMGMMSPRRVEGRIAFLNAELKITEAQQPAWTAFADALRAEARSREGMRQRMMGHRMGQGMGQGVGMPMATPRGMAGMPGADVPFPEQAERRVQNLTARLDAARAIAATGNALYDVLTDEQKKTADELLTMAMRGM
jgi:hypothetical protein